MSKTLFEKNGLYIRSSSGEDEKGLGLQFEIDEGEDCFFEFAQFHDPEDIRKIIRVLTDWLFDKKKDERKEKVS